MSDPLWYPSVEDVLDIHDDIVSEYPDTSPGVRNRGDVEFALDYVEEGSLRTSPETIHEKAFHLLRLLVASHPFVDGNKRTALNTVVVFYFLNGYRLDYDDEIRDVLKRFATDERAANEERVTANLQANSEGIDLAEAVEKWRDELIQHGLEQLTDESSDPND